jgi:hypothetical protein
MASVLTYQEVRQGKSAIGWGVECTAKFSYLITLRFTTNFNVCDRDYKGNELYLTGQVFIRVHAFWRLKMAIHSQPKNFILK